MVSDAVKDPPWPIMAIDACRVAIRSVENTEMECRPSWYFMARDAVRKFEQDRKPLPEWMDWEYMERGP